MFADLTAIAVPPSTDLSTVIAIGVLTLIGTALKAVIDYYQRKAAHGQIADVKAVATSTHGLVNGSMGAQLTAYAVLAHKHADATQSPADIRAAEIAEQLAADHVARCAAAKEAAETSVATKKGQRGSVRHDVLIALAALAAAVAVLWLGVTSGCGTTTGHVLRQRIVDHGPPPACRVIWSVDGREIDRADLDDCSNLRACPEATP